ncbi:MAG: Xaa-Pro peptidase family protein [Syntrophomonadaceae bacterium]|nr:Xaa-Pro peptidase family protein [Syntrophomonadaceae bacterium]
MDRLNKLRLVMREAELPALLVSRPANILYISGFSGGSDGRLLITEKDAYLLTDGRYFEQAARECAQWTVVPVKAGEPDPLLKLCAGAAELGVEAEYISAAQYLRLQATIMPKLRDFSGAIEKMRLIKEEGELALLRASAAISDRVWRGMLAELEPGMREDYIAARIAFRLREEGCSGEAFATIAASGENGALPHAHPGERRLCPGDLLTCDFGGVYLHYAGDMTRTIAVESLSPVWRERYQRLLEVQELAVARVQAGISGEEIYHLAVRELARYELERYFNHGLGHGVGLEVHEGPRLSAASSDILQENMVVTVEPGIYFPGQGGIRIEDTVIVNSRGCERITRSDKILTIL